MCHDRQSGRNATNRGIERSSPGWDAVPATRRKKQILNKTEGGPQNFGRDISRVKKNKRREGQQQHCQDRLAAIHRHPRANRPDHQHPRVLKQEPADVEYHRFGAAAYFGQQISQHNRRRIKQGGEQRRAVRNRPCAERPLRIRSAFHQQLRQTRWYLVVSRPRGR